MLACLSRRRSWVQIPSGTLKSQERRVESGESRVTSQKGTNHYAGPRLLTLDPRPEQHGTQTWKSGEAQTFVTLWVRLPPVLLDWVVLLAAACKAVVTKQARWTTRGSIPSRPTQRTARSSNGRMRDPHSRDAGSIPARVTEHGQVVELGYTRRSERRALCGMGVRISPWLLTRVSQCSVRPHKPRLSGATPEPAT